MIDIRPARLEEVDELKKDLARDKRWEQVDLTKGVVFVATKDNEIVEYAQARLVWQIEPLKFVHGKRNKLTPMEQKRTTYALAMTMIDWLRDVRNNPYVRFFFCYIMSRKMQRYAPRLGLIPLYGKGKFFGKDL